MSTQNAVTAVIFDFGGVLVDWDPRHLYRKLFAGRPAEMKWFLTHVVTGEWNMRHDCDIPMLQNIADLSARYPHYAEEIAAFHSRWRELIAGDIPGTVRLLRQLHDRGVPLYGLTNWSAETYPIAEEMFDFLSLFRDIAVSGRLGYMKPDPRIYNWLAERNGLDPSKTLFIDDNLKNIQAARSIGYHVHHFSAPDALSAELTARELL